MAMAMLLLKSLSLVPSCGLHTVAANLTEPIYNTTNTLSSKPVSTIDHGSTSKIAAVMAHLEPQGEVQLPNLDSPKNNIRGNVTAIPQANVEVITAARQPVDEQDRTTPRPMYNPGVMCYRNALLIVLLNSDRFMGYIQNHHVKQVLRLQVRADAARISLRNNSNQDGPLLAHGHTDVLLQLNNVWTVYWEEIGHRHLDEAVDAFWDYLKTLDYSSLGILRWTFRGQQDSEEFFGHHISVARAQMGLEPALWDEIPHLNSMVECVTCVMKRCSRCRKTDNVKIRLPNETSDVWTIPVDDYAIAIETHKRYLRTRLDLNESIRRGITKEISGAWYCGVCDPLWRTEVYEKTENKANYQQNVQAEANRLSRPEFSDFVWRTHRRLPETLFTQMKIFEHCGGTTTRKRFIRLIIPEQIDVAADIEQGVFVGSTKYNLSGVVCHGGNSIDSGHYIAYVKHRGKWWRVEDRPEREQVDFKAVNNPPSGFVPYLMLWEKVPEAEEAEGGLIRQTTPTKEATAPGPKGNPETSPKPPPNASTRPICVPHPRPQVKPLDPTKIPGPSGMIVGTYTIAGHKLSYKIMIPHIPDLIPRTYAPHGNAETPSKLKEVAVEHHGGIGLYGSNGHPNTNYDILDSLHEGTVNSENDIRMSASRKTAWFDWYNEIPDAKGFIYNPATKERKEVASKPQRRPSKIAIQPVSPSEKKPITKDAGTDPKTPPISKVSEVTGVATSPRSPNPPRRSPRQPSSASSSNSNSSSDPSPPPPDSHPAGSPVAGSSSAPKPIKKPAIKPATQPTRTNISRKAKSAVLEDPPWLTDGQKRRRAEEENGDDDDNKPEKKAQKTTAAGKGKAPVKKASKTGKATKPITAAKTRPKTKAGKPKKAPAKRGGGKPPKRKKEDEARK